MVVFVKMDDARQEHVQRRRKELYDVIINHSNIDEAFDIIERERPTILGEDNKLHYSHFDAEPRYLAALDVLVNRRQCTRKERY
jgi:hypothetical protein